GSALNLRNGANRWEWSHRPASQSNILAALYNNTFILRLSTTDLSPGTTDTQKLGSSSLVWADLRATGITLTAIAATDIAAAANAINTTNKSAGRVVFVTTNSRLMIAAGSDA